jgi:hypothetical protein
MCCSELEAAKLSVLLLLRRCPPSDSRPRVDPVFFASHCGGKSGTPPSAAAASSQSVKDRRLSTLAAAVEFAKANNLLGILVDSELLASHMIDLLESIN